MATENKRPVMLRASSATWAVNDIVPLEGEICVTVNGVNSRIKVGDGVSLHSVLNFISRRTDAEFSVAVDTILAAESTDVSTGVPDAGKLVALDAAGVIDSSMISGVSGGSFTILGEVDFTAAPPVPPAAGYQAGDAYVNDTAGQFNAAWLFGLDALGNERSAQVGDIIIFDVTLGGGPGWRWFGSRRLLDLIDHDYANDAAASAGGIPIGGLYHTSGAVKVRIA